MNKQINDDNSPSYIGWQYLDGSIRITVESGADHVDDDTTLFTYSPSAGIEAGQSRVASLVEHPSIIVFKGTYDDQRKCFDAWALLARVNERPTIFRREGMAALARLDPAPVPPLPVIDQDATERANEVLKVSRMLMLEVAETKELTLEDCRVIAATVADAIANDAP